MDTTADTDWAPEECTLPSRERPFRLAEFDALLAGARSAERLTDQHLRVNLPQAAGLAARVRDLAARESRCCSFFEFNVAAHDFGVDLDVRVPPQHTTILDALRAKATNGSEA